MLAALPLRSDTTEGPNIYGCLIDLVISGDASTLTLMPQVLNAFGETLTVNSNAVAEVKGMVTLCLKELATGANQPTFLAAIERVEPTNSAAIQLALNTPH
jgi:hypothetical protein